MRRGQAIESTHADLAFPMRDNCVSGDRVNFRLARNLLDWPSSQ
jgi:hypothetical protein